jgi:signal transduction histidine kinase
VGAARVARIPRTAAVVVAPLAVGYGLLATWVAAGDGAVSTYAGRSTAAAVFELAAGWALIAAGTAYWLRRPTWPAGPLAVVAGFAWFAPDWVGWQTGPGAVRALALATAGVCAAALVHLALGAPTGSVSSRASGAVVTATWALTALVGIGRVLFYDPFADPSCVTWCSPNPLLADGDRSFARTLDWIELVVAVVGLLWVVIAGARRVARASPAARRSICPIVVPAGVFLAAWTLRVIVVVLTPGEDPRRSVLTVAFVVRAAALAALAAGFLWALGRAVRSSLAVRRLAREPGTAASDRSLEAALVEATGDSSLRIAFPLLDGDLWIDGEGMPVDAPRQRSDSAVTMVVRAGQPVAAVIHDSEILDGSLLAREIGTAAQLAVDNERLRAEARLRLRELRASRSRIVETGDAERRRLERDLHDGAQQRLVGISVALGMAQTALKDKRDRGAVASLQDAAAELQRAIVELRELAHGIHPVELSEEGLAAAIDALADRARILVGSLPAERFPAAVETAAYLLVEDLTRRAEARRDGAILSVAARRARDRLVVVVDDPGETSRDLLAADLVAVGDRIGALEGRLSIAALSSVGVRVEAELPCG